MKKKDNIRALFRVLDRWKWQYGGASLLLITSIFFRSVEPRILQIVVDYALAWYKAVDEVAIPTDWVGGFLVKLIPDPTVSSATLVLLSLGLMYMAVSTLRGLLMLVASAVTASSTEHAIMDLRNKLFAHIQRLPLSYFGKTATGELVQKATGDVDTVRRFMLNQVVELVRMLAIFSFAFMMMLLVEWRLALICIVLVPIVSLTSYLFFQRERKLWEEHEAEADKLNSITQENLNGIRVVKAFAMEAHENERFDRQNEKKRSIGLRHVWLHKWFWTFSDLMVHIQFTISVLAGGYFVLDGQMSLGELMGFHTYMMMVSWPLRQAGQVVSQMGMAVVAMGRIQKIMQAKEEDYEEGGSRKALRGQIEFKNVSFRYTTDQDWVLKNVSFKIEAGERVAFVGPAGSGKSSILKLLQRFYKPQEGQILLDGEPIEDYDRDWLRFRMGMALQTPFLFSTTVRNNISYAAEDNNEKLMKVAALAGALELEDILAEGFDSQVGEKGVSLSGGQKQRIALARTLFTEPDLLILDDVTSAVDTETELNIFDALAGSINQRTTLVVSHRMTSIQLSDRAIVLENGGVTADGTLKELSQKEGYFRDIHELQLGLEKDIQADLQNNKEDNGTVSG